METWNPVKVGKHMHIPHDVWSCQLGRTGQLIRRINFFLQTIKSFIKDLYAVCQNCDHRRRVTAASETRGRLVGLQNTRAFLFSWDWKLTKTARKSNERMNTRFFLPKVSPKWQNGPLCAGCFDFVFYRKPEKEATMQQLLLFGGINYVFISGNKIMACDDVLESRSMAMIVNNITSPSRQILNMRCPTDLYFQLMFENHAHLSKVSVSTRTFYTAKKEKKKTENCGSSHFVRLFLCPKCGY